MYLSKKGPELGEEHALRYFPKSFTIGSKFQLGRNLADDGREVSACHQPACLNAGLTGIRNDFQPLHLFRSCAKGGKK